jgi:hypothetical protein
MRLDELKWDKPGAAIRRAELPFGAVWFFSPGTYTIYAYGDAVYGGLDPATAQAILYEILKK